jgi:hypothetical protein
MRSIKKLSTAIVLIALSLVIGVTSVRADPSTPVNYISTSISPITTTISYNYNYLTGALTLGTATATALTINNMFFTVTADPDPPGNGFGTFFGTGQPVHFQGDEVVSTSSFCPGWVPVTGGTGLTGCLAMGTLTFGGFVIVHSFNAPLSAVTILATQYNFQAGSCGGGSPRFSLTTSLGSAHNIFVYTGPISTSFNGGCMPNIWTNPGSGINYADNAAGARWDIGQLKTAPTSAVCLATPTYTIYSGAVACAASLGATIQVIFLVTDGGWSALGGAPFTGQTAAAGTQTALFRNIQVNSVTRFP